MDRLFLSKGAEPLGTAYASPQFERAAAQDGTWESRLVFLRGLLDWCEKVPILIDFSSRRKNSLGEFETGSTGHDVDSAALTACGMDISLEAATVCEEHVSATLMGRNELYLYGTSGQLFCSQLKPKLRLAIAKR
jgi:hypothetical protein